MYQLGKMSITNVYKAMMILRQLALTKKGNGGGNLTFCIKTDLLALTKTKKFLTWFLSFFQHCFDF